MTSIRSWVGHRARELLVHAHRLSQPAAPGRRVLIFPGEAATGSGSDLRAVAVARELGRLGWRATVVPSQLELQQRLRIIRAERPDVILLHQSRHPLNRPRYYPDTPCVFDADDADILDPKCRDDVIECCADSVAIVAGSRFLADAFRPYNPRVSVVWTGTYLQPSPQMVPSELRLPSVAWATSDAVGYSHEAEFVREVIVRLAQKTQFNYLQYGVRADQRDAVEKFLVPVRRAGVPVKIFEPALYKQFVGSLESVAVGLQPVCMENPFSRGKSFGKLLAYLTADVAIVASDAVDHPLFFRDGVNGVLAPNDVDRWVEGTALLLQDPSRRARMVANARAGFQARLTTAVAAKLVGDVLLDAIGGADRSPRNQFGARSQI
jgi:Glycosyl transferases group 1